MIIEFDQIYRRSRFMFQDWQANDRNLAFEECQWRSASSVQLVLRFQGISPVSFHGLALQSAHARQPFGFSVGRKSSLGSESF
jgi:hypothetical protein